MCHFVNKGEFDDRSSRMKCETMHLFGEESNKVHETRMKQVNNDPRGGIEIVLYP